MGLDCSAEKFEELKRAGDLVLLGKGPTYRLSNKWIVNVIKLKNGSYRIEEAFESDAGGLSDFGAALAKLLR